MNTLMIFLLSGLWHGANWTFLFWGGLHGSIMVVEKILKDLGIGIKRLPRGLEKVKGALQWAMTFFLINIAWVFFRAESMEQAKLFLSRLFGGGWGLSPKIQEYVMDIIEVRIIKRLGLEQILESNAALFIVLVLVMLVLICVFTKNTGEKTEDFNFSLKEGVVTVLLLVWCIVSLSSISEFLYFEF